MVKIFGDLKHARHNPDTENSVPKFFDFLTFLSFSPLLVTLANSYDHRHGRPVGIRHEISLGWKAREER